MNTKSFLFFIIFSIFPFRAASMDKKPNNVVHLDTLQAKAEQELKQAQDTWKKLPQSWRANAKEAAQKVDQTNARLKKLQEINASRNSQQVVQFSAKKQSSNVVSMANFKGKTTEEKLNPEKKAKKLATQQKISKTYQILPPVPSVSTPERTTNVLTLQQLEDEARENLRKFQNYSSNMHFLDRPLANEDSFEINRMCEQWNTTEKRYKKLQSINTFQAAKQHPNNAVGYLQYLDQLEKEEKIRLNAVKKAEKKLKFGDKFGAANILDGYARYDVMQEKIDHERIAVQRALKSQNPPEPPSIPRTLFSKTFGGATALASCIAETDALKNQPPITLDSFLSGLAEVSADFAITAAFGIPVSIALNACSQAKTVREQLEKMDATITSNPFTDAWCGMNLGCSYQESVEGLKVVLSAAEKLDATKRNVIESTQEHLNAFVTYVYEGYQSFKKSNPDLFKTKVQKKQKSIPPFDSDTFEPDKSLEEYLQQEIRRAQRYQEEIKRLHQERTNNQKSDESDSNEDSEFDENDAQHHFHRCSQVYELPADQQEPVDTPLTLETCAKLFKNQIDKLEQYKEYKNEKEYQNAFSNAVGGVNGVATIVGILGHRKEAWQIRTAGFSCLQAFDCMRTIANKGLMGAGIHPVIGILAAVESICGLLQDDDDNAFQAVLDAITQGVMHLSQQLHEMHEEMREQFAEVHKKLNRHHLVMLEQFFALHQNQTNFMLKLQDLHRYIQTNHRAIHDDLAALHAKIDSSFKMTLDNLNGLRIEGIDELIDSLRDDMPPKEFNKRLKKLFRKATILASADSLTGGSIDLHSPIAIQTILEGPTVLQNIFEHSAFSHVNFLSRYLAGNFQGFKHKKLVNPLIWIRCVEAIVKILEQKLEDDDYYPSGDTMKDRDIQKLLMLKKQGEKINAFIEKIAQGNYIEQIARNHKNALEQLSQAIKEEQKVFEKKVTKELCEMQSAEIEEEKSKTQRIITSYECKKCVEHVAHFLQPTNMYNRFLRIPSRPYKTYYKDTLDTQPWCYPPVLPECKEAYDICKGTKTPYNIINPTERFKQLFQEYAHNVAQQEEHLLKSTHLDLAQSVFHAIGNGKSRWMYPENPDSNLPTLTRPTQNLPYNFWYVVAENRGLGTITHEYSIENDNFHIRSYFTSKKDKQKIKILDIFKAYTPEQEYAFYEDILHYWYGGRHARVTAGDYLKIGFRDGGNFSYPYPPTTPYQAERDIFVGTAQSAQDQSNRFGSEVRQLIGEDLEEKRLHFNQEVMTHLSSKSATSAIFNAAQQVDVNFKILDALLTLMYHDLMDEDQRAQYPEFAALISDDEQSMKNLSAITHYVQKYSSNKDREHKQGNYLPFYIQRTTNKLSRAIKQINNAHYQPQFASVIRMINALNRLITDYNVRAITPRVIHLKSTQEDNPELLALMLKQNEKLKKSHRKLAQETLALKQEVIGMREQQQQMMALLVAMNNRTQTTGNLSNVSLAQKPSVVDTKSSSFITRVKKIKVQVVAECGYHALFNALQCFKSDLSFEQFMQNNKQRIKDKRNSSDDQWLSEDELSDLAQHNVSFEMNITVIPDITRYALGKSGLEYTVLADLVRSQDAIERKTEAYKHVFVGRLGRTDQARTHWIAVEQKIEKGIVKYTVMNSLSSYSHQEFVKTLQDILHNTDNKHDIVVYDTLVEETLSGYISQLQLHDIFVSRSYARTGESRASKYRIVNKSVEKIVDDILDAAQQLLEITNGDSFWSTCGYIEPKALVQKVLEAFVDCQGESIKYKNSIDDEDEHEAVLHISEEQQQKINTLEEVLIP